MKKDPRFLYVLHDAELNLYKVGSSVRPYGRVRELSIRLKRHLDIEYITPGHDYFIRKYNLPRTNHPVKHNGFTEWYEATEEMTDFLIMIWRAPGIPARTRTV